MPRANHRPLTQPVRRRIYETVEAAGENGVSVAAMFSKFKPYGKGAVELRMVELISEGLVEVRKVPFRAGSQRNAPVYFAREDD